MISMSDEMSSEGSHLQPVLWLTLSIYVVLSIGVAVYIDRFTSAGTSGTPRDLGVSEAALLVFLFLVFGALVGGGALLVAKPARAVGLRLLAGVPVAVVGMITFVVIFGR
jgi:hypothetical protein